MQRGRASVTSARRLGATTGGRQLLFGAVVMSGCRSVGDTDPNPAAVTWANVFDTTGMGALSGIWGSAPDDVFIVGGSDRGGEIVHYDGTDWSPMAVPDGAGLLVWVYGFGPDDVYAVGVDGTAIHFDGAAWSPLATGTTEDLWGVFGFAPDDLWVVGGNADEDVPLLLHHDGVGFTPVPLDPAENNRGATTLFKVWGIGDTLFAVGQHGLVVRWNGAAWTQVEAGAEANDDFVSLWGDAADHIVAVGGRANARVAEWDGSTWTTWAPTATAGLDGVWMGDDGTAHIGGVYGWLGTWSEAEHAPVLEDQSHLGDVHSLWGDGAGRVYAVGGSFLAPYSGLALVRTEE